MHVIYIARSLSNYTLYIHIYPYVVGAVLRLGHQAAVVAGRSEFDRARYPPANAFNRKSQTFPSQVPTHARNRNRMRE